MTKVKLSRQSLRIISLLQNRHQRALKEYDSRHSNDWYKQIQAYFEGFNDDLIVQSGLEKNKPCLDAILNFKMTDKVKCVVHEGLLDMDFCY